MIRLRAILFIVYDRGHHLLAEPGEAEAEDQGQAEGTVAGADDRAATGSF